MKKKLRKVLMPRMRRPRLFLDRRKRERAGKAMDYEAAIENIPRITNETVAEHREEVLSTARKYIYPLQHSKHRIVAVSIILFVVAVIIFFSYVFLALYRFHSTSTFIYRVTQVVPLPVAKTDVGFVSYEDYLFELRHYLHYYEMHQHVDFSSGSGQDQLKSFRERSLAQVIDRAYIKQLARKEKVSVSAAEVNRTIELLKDQNRLGNNDQVFKDVLKQFWGWSVDDFKRELASEMLEQKLVAKLDTAATAQAEAALRDLHAGRAFADVAKAYSQDTSKAQGGVYPSPVKKNNRDISPQVMGVLFTLKDGGISDIINAGTALEIVTVHSGDGNQVKASHIVIPLKPLSEHLDAFKKQYPKPTQYINTEK